MCGWLKGTRKIDVKLDNGSICPTKAHESDAGYDIYAPANMESGVIRPNSSLVIDTGVHMQIPDGYCGLIVSKSGLNVNNGITSTGLIDAGYQGSIKIKLYNNTGSFYTVKPCEKISQIVILPIPEFELGLVSEFEAQTDRGVGGFGSSGRF